MKVFETRHWKALRRRANLNIVTIGDAVTTVSSEAQTRERIVDLCKITFRKHIVLLTRVRFIMIKLCKIGRYSIYCLSCPRWRASISAATWIPAFAGMTTLLPD
jgi:hypothetical protein